MKTVAKIIAGVAMTALLVLSVPVIHYFPLYNARTVEDGVLYGARQMGGSALESAIKKKGIRTVINLRGENPGSDWYDEEVAACARAGVNHVNFPWSKNSIPDPESLARFLDLMETGEKPFLAHCQGGTHRTGVAAAAYLLLKGASTDIAREQFRMGFNDAPIGQLLDLYEGSDMPFKQWVRDIYPAKYDAWKQQREQAEKAAKAPALLAAPALQ